MKKCIHGIYAYYCKECDGKGLCQHDKKKSICIECGGSEICKHKRHKYRCKECRGSQICSHGKDKYFCFECKGLAFCPHKKEKRFCKECGGVSICKHGKRRNHCVDCGGAVICEHKKVKYICKICDGSRFCSHGKDKPMCRDCGGSALCKTPYCETAKNKKYKGYCLRCFVFNYPDEPNSKNYKTKEKSVVDFILREFTDKTIITDKRIEDGCSRRRPDVYIDMGDYLVIVEVDENQHIKYDCSCENKRIMELSLDVGHRPIVFIRFNPDEYLGGDGKKVTSCWGIDGHGMAVVKKTKTKEWSDRLSVLKEQINYWLSNKTDKTVEIVQLFYDQNIISETNSENDEDKTRITHV
jgi:hypothetical protein